MARLHRRFATGAYGLPAPSLSLDFILSPSSALSILTFTRASAGTYFDSAGVLQTALTNVARFDFLSGTALGLLIEEARTNVVKHRRDLTNAVWTATDITPLKNITGIDGVANSASRITATGSNGTILQSITLASSARFQTAWVKRITGSGTVEMTMDNGSTWTAITVTSTTVWSRVSIPTQTLANPTIGFRIVTSGDAIAVDFVQNENGTIATSTIPDTDPTASVTRAADVCSILTSAFPFNAGNGTYFVEFSQLGIASGESQQIIQCDDGSDNNRDLVFVGQAIGQVSANSIAATANQGRLDGAAWAANTVFRAAYAVAASDRALSVNGAAAVTSSTYTAPSGQTTLRLGGTSAGTSFKGHIRRLSYYPRRLSNIQLQALTA